MSSKNRDYISIDLETTGLDPKRDRIIEIGAVKIREGKVVSEFSSFVNPQRPLSNRIIELTGITENDLIGAPVISDALPKLMEFLGNDVLLGHSILFDYSFIKQAAVNEKLKFERLGIDTLKIARRYLPELEHRSLDYLCNYYQITHQAHRALEDATATHLLYHKLIEEFGKEDSLFYGTPLLYKVKRETPLTIPQREQLERMADKYYQLTDIPINNLTRSEASRYLNQILEECGR